MKINHANIVHTSMIDDHKLRVNLGTGGRSPTATEIQIEL